jgi:hypothetical protein
MIYSQLAETVENVYHVKNDSGWTSASLSALGLLFTNWESAHAAPGRNNQTELIKVIVTDLTTQFGLQVTNDIVPPIVGGQTGQAGPNNVTLAVSWRSDVRGRNFRGRTFHIGMEEDQYSGNSAVAATLTNLLSMYGFLLTAVNAVTGQHLVVLSRRLGGNPRPAGVGTNITHISINHVMDSQRRRLPEHGRHR